MRASHRPGCAIALALLALTACENAGEDRVLALSASGVVNGLVYLDGNSDRQFNLGFDSRLANVGVALVARGTRDTVARVTSDAQGLVRFAGVPVGHYTVAVDTTLFADTIAVTGIDSVGLQILPADSTIVLVAVSYPRVTTVEARTLAVGTKVFLRGIALTTTAHFGDTLLHLRDSAGAMRVFVTTGNPFLRDSLTFLGRIGVRSGAPILDQAVLVALTCVPPACPYPDPPSDTVTNAVARVAGGGPSFLLDAALIRILGDTIVDTTRVTAQPDSNDLLVRAFDGTDTLVVHLDSTFAFSGGYPSGLVGGAILDVTGVLVPTGTGSWRLKPRSGTDITIR